jgi:uncharacterized protein (TIGR00661 family)
LRKTKNFYKDRRNPRVLIAPLDWGLGHTTRCIPIINELIQQQCDVYIAADKQAFSLLKKEFPKSVFLRCRGYEIRYSKQKKFFAFKLILQMPGVLFKVWQEKSYLKKIIKTHDIDAVISDNRFGMYNQNIPSFYITHQLAIKTGNRFTESIAQKIHYYFINKFHTCWIPDEEKNGLAGELSHPKKMPANVIYVGPLSRFTFIATGDETYDLLIILSGPEPQRTIFENLILNQISEIEGNIFLVRGLPGEKAKPASPKNITVENHLTANEMNAVLSKSKLVLCRSGYTSVMDLSILGKKAILVPTPGQTEQEYLAKYLMEKKYFLCESQENFSIKAAIEKAKLFYFKKPDLEPQKFKRTIAELAASLKAGKLK